MSILEPTKEECKHHLKECNHCRHWYKWLIHYKIKANKR
jgi:predicted anti-sigma-YlaC factor YlaD